MSCEVLAVPRRPQGRGHRRAQIPARADHQRYRQGAGAAMHAGLLTPQGKILFDFFVVPTGEEFLLDVAQDKAAELAEAARFLPVTGASRDRLGPRTRRGGGVGRNPSPGRRRHHLCRSAAGRAWLPRWSCPRAPRQLCSAASAATEEDYHALRIALGVPEGGRDYAFGDAFPHEALFDQIERRRFHEGLLCRPGGRLAHAASRHGAQALPAGRGRSRPCPLRAR